MTAGHAIHLKNVNKSSVQDVVVDGWPMGNKKLYDGIWFDSSSFNSYIGGNIYVSHYGLDVNNGVELNLDNITIINQGDTGIHMGGGFGGLYLGYVALSCNGATPATSGAVGLRVDNALTATTNLQIFVSNRTTFDRCAAANVYVADSTSSVHGIKQISWLGWASGSQGVGIPGIDIVSWNNGEVNIGGGATIINNEGDGILINDDTAYVRIDEGANLSTNGASGVNCTVPVTRLFSATNATFTTNCKAGEVSSASWPTFTPSVTCGTATITVNSATYRTEGKTTNFGLDFTISTLGTCTNAASFTLPNTSGSSSGFAGREGTAGTKNIICGLVPSATTSGCSFSAAAGAGERYTLGGTYENQ
jgi:hypothetical protein